MALGRHPAGTGGRGHGSPSARHLCGSGGLSGSMCAFVSASVSLSNSLCLSLCLPSLEVSVSLCSSLFCVSLPLSSPLFLPQASPYRWSPRPLPQRSPSVSHDPSLLTPLISSVACALSPDSILAFPASMTQSGWGMMTNLVSFASLHSGLWGGDPTPGGHTGSSCCAFVQAEPGA